jgi:hypothetical protein
VIFSFSFLYFLFLEILNVFLKNNFLNIFQIRNFLFEQFSNSNIFYI